MKIISLEGPDFSGKTTIGTSLLMKLRDKGLRVERMELPSRLVTGIFTELLRNSKDKIDPRVYSLTYAADHLNHYLSLKKHNGSDVIILERSAVSFFVYQGLALGADMKWLKEINKYNQLVPDITFIPKVPVAELQRRRQIRVGMSDAFEKSSFLKKVAKIYYDLPGWIKRKYNVKYLEYDELEPLTDKMSSLSEKIIKSR